MAFDGSKVNVDAYCKASNIQNESVCSGDVASDSSKASRESAESHRDKVKSEISKVQEFLPAKEHLHNFVSNKDKTIPGTSAQSQRTNRRITMQEMDNDPKYSKLSQTQLVDTAYNDAICNSDNNGENADNCDINDNSCNTRNVDCGRRAGVGLHGNTSKVAANFRGKDVYDWNVLPNINESILIKHSSFNVIYVPVDGEIKQIFYSPSYNENFRPMNIFLSFNRDTKSVDTRLHAKKRLQSFSDYVEQCMKKRLHDHQRFLFQEQKSVADKTYESSDTSKYYSEAETIISLWYMQSEKCVSQSNSNFFSGDVLQHLLQRKSRHQTSIAVYIPGTGSTGTTTKSNESIDNIDILLLRPYQEPRLGWQLAYDEPNLRIADYPIDITPWMMDEEDIRVVLESQNSSDSSTMLNIVSDKNELVEINNQNAGNYLIDCMGRRSPYEDDEIGRIGGEPAYKNNVESNSETYAERSRKKVASKLGKKTGLSSLFKRKHPARAMPPLAVSTSSSSTKKHPLTRDIHGHQVDNVWLENYLGQYLSNYRKVDLSTRFILPKEARNTQRDHSATTNNEATSDPKKALFYSKESLQLRLPFGDNTIPSILAPSIWTILACNKWRNLLREIYRIIVPGGYVLLSLLDIGISNSFSSTKDEHTQEFRTTEERDRLLDAISIAAIKKGVQIHPTQHIAQTVREVGFTDLKYSILDLKTGDCSTEMGCFYEVYSEITWDSLLRNFLPDPTKRPKGTEPMTLFKRYVKEHMDKIDKTAGSLRVLYLVARKPR